MAAESRGTGSPLEVSPLDDVLFEEFGVHFHGDRRVGDRFVCGWDLPEQPSEYGLTAEGTIETYENAKHGFAVTGHLVYDKDASERHWERLLRLLLETLH